jgi:hypothetical protein
MADDVFKYGMMVEDALRGVVKRSLTMAEKHGLPGNHHFYITFRTGAPGVRVPPYLGEKYPDEMTIVLQYQFWNLEVLEERFEVTLSFNDVHERLIVPYVAITSFADPSEKFGLQFQGSGGAEATTEGNILEDVVAGETPLSDSAEADDDPGAGNGNTDTVAADTGTAGDGSDRIVSLDQFRKKK